MPKFSAYMRGEEGPQGETGQASLYDGVLNSSTELPQILINDKNYVYYVRDGDDVHIYTYTTTSEKWEDLGSVKGDKGNDGVAAGFSTNQRVSVSTLNHNLNAFVNITPDNNTPDTDKVFNFNFGIPTGKPGGFSTKQNIDIQQIDYTENPSASITVDETSPDYSKVFNFDLKIPRGEPGGFGEPTISVSSIEPYSTPSATISTEGDSTAKIFNFHFNIPKGLKGDKGDAFSIYESISFSTTSEYWDENVLKIPRGNNKKIPIFIKDNDNNVTYTNYNIDDNYIYYNAGEPFNGVIYCATPTERGTISIGNVSSTTYDHNSIIIPNEQSTSSDLILDFVLQQGPKGDSIDFSSPIISVSTISSSSEPHAEVSITSEIDSETTKILNFHFDIPQGPKGDAGDSLAIYEGLSFSTDTENYWEENTLIIPCGENKKLPLFIFNNDNKTIAATFNIITRDNKDYITYTADERFNGTIYLASKSNRGTITIGTVSTTTYGNNAQVTLDPSSTSTDVKLNFVLPTGPQGETALTAEVGNVSSTTGEPSVTIRGEQNLFFDFDLPKGDKGDLFTVDVDEDIEVLDVTEKGAVETTETTTGIKLKFKLPPTISDVWGTLAKKNTILLNTNEVSGILPIEHGGTGNNEGIAQSANSAAKLSPGATIQVALGNANAVKFDGSVNITPGISGVLGVEHGGTATTTLSGIHNLLFTNDYSNENAKQITAMSDWGNGGFITLPLPVGYGGTGVTTAIANTIFAAPSNNDGTPTFRKLVANDIPTSLGDMTFTGTVTLTKTTNASGVTNNSPALIVGGTSTTAHLELDSNKIVTKADSTTTAELFINNDGGKVNIGPDGIKIGLTGSDIKGIAITSTDPGEDASLTTGWLLFVYKQGE